MAAHDYQNDLPLSKPKRSSAAMHLLKLVRYMLRLKSKKSKSNSIQVNGASSSSWKGVLGSMRPMHLQSNQSPPPAIEAKTAIIPPASESTPEEAITLLVSPMADVSARSPPLSISSYGSVGDMSQFESPSNQDIHVIKPSEEITEEECWYDDEGGDEMIDAKAEEFIAHFYEQMRLQNLN
ncbi:hypothetical protein REPUB_Repub17cG0118900 [Reevesia pubescens]